MDNETLEKIKANLSEGREKLGELKEDIQKARKAGINTEKMERSYEALKIKIDRMAAVYG